VKVFFSRYSSPIAINSAKHDRLAPPPAVDNNFVIDDITGFKMDIKSQLKSSSAV